VSYDIFDETGRFQSGFKSLSMWPFYKCDSRLGCMKEYHGIADSLNPGPESFTYLSLQFDEFISPMYWSPREYQDILKKEFSINPDDEQDKVLLTAIPEISALAKLKKLLVRDPLQQFSEEEKRILFIAREHYCILSGINKDTVKKTNYQMISHSLPIFLKSVDWSRPVQVSEVYRMLKVCEPMDPEEAISLLNAKIPDEDVRLYAVKRIRLMSDDNLASYMLQFSQALLYENHHYSHLAEMLIERALKNPCIVGHAFFWALKSNLNLKTSYERYSILLEQFLMLCGKYKEELLIQTQVNEQLTNVSVKIMELRSKKSKDKKRNLSEEAKRLLYEARQKLPLLFTFALEPKVIIRDFDYEQTRVFDSKKAPLRLVGVNNQPGGENVSVIFKNGDDLRQDILTLQMIYLIDKIWLENNLDFKMSPYRVLGTGDQQGYLEFVSRSKTLADLQRMKTFGAFKDEVITEYFHNLTSKQEKGKLTTIHDNFLHSTAGYCVATYILGIGDRHPDNIMVSMDGFLFHIDFGHFLGHKKKKFGYERERDPFVFTPDIKHFIDQQPYVVTKGDNKEKVKVEAFSKFQKLCCEGYNCIRKYGHKLINIFLIMLSAGMPELSSEIEIAYLRDKLSMELTDEEASEKFMKEIDAALTTLYRRVDNMFHNMRRG